MQKFGNYVRKKREKLQEKDKIFSQRQVGLAIGIEPSYLSKIERGQPVALSEEKIIALAKVLQEDPDFLLALGGKLSKDVQDIIKKRPMLFSRLVRAMKDLSDEEIETDKEFKQIQNQLHRLHDLASIGSFQFNEDKKTSYWTGQSPSILRISQSAAPSMESISQALAPDERERFDALRNRALAKNETYHCELQLSAMPEDPGYIKIWGYFEKDKITNMTADLGIIQDATEIVQLRNKIQAAQESLQETVKEQGAELSASIEKLTSERSSRKELEAELMETQAKIVEEADIQNEFFRDRTYSLRSLMNRFIAEQTDLNGTLDSTLNIKRLFAKVKDMGDFFTSKEGLSIEESPFNINEALSHIILEFENDFKLNSVKLTLFMSPEIPAYIVSDKHRLEQMVTALLELFLVNTPWGYVQLSATIDATSKHLIISLTSPSRNRKIKDSLFSACTLKGKNSFESNPTQLIRPILDAFNGEIFIEESTGAGILVNVHIPVKTHAPKQKTTPSKAITVLVVEDDLQSRIYIVKALENRGYEVIPVANGKDALEQANTRKFNIILLDIQLPDFDGIQVSRQIRQNENSLNKKIPIVAVTAHAMQSDREKYIAGGIEGFISKPFEIHVLLEEIAKYI